MQEQISIADFIDQTWEDYKSPTTSTFDKKLGKCRSTVSQIEEELDTDRSELTKLKKSVRALCNSTNKHAQNEKDISENLERIGNTTTTHKDIKSALLEFARVTKILGSLIEDLSKNLYNSLQFPLESFLKGDIKGVKGDLRKPFDKAWKDYESRFTKLEKDAKKKASDGGMLYRQELSGGEVAEEMKKERKMFQLQMCTYLVKVNDIKTKKGVDLLNSLVEYYKAVKLFFQKGASEIAKHETFVENLGVQLKDLKQSQSTERTKLLELQNSLKNSMDGYKEPSSTVATPPGYSLHQLQGNKNHGSIKEGYLLKKSEGMLKKVWQKRKCKIKDGIMLISHSDETKEPVRLNLLTCQVKLVSEDPGKKCFDLVSSHGNRTYHFQADDEKEMEQWISVLSNAKEDVLLKAFKDSSSCTTMNESVKELTKTIIDRIEKLPGNNECCDCGSPDPKWLSTNLGVLICLECCGIHRNLGVHVSRTQSLEIDQLGTSQLLLARVIGNANFNEVLEARLGDRTRKPQSNSQMADREEFIKAKYVHHKFTIQTCSDTTELQQDLKQSIQTRDIQALIQVYAEGLDLMTVLPESSIEETALHLAIAEEDGTSLPIVDFIVQNSSLNSLGRQTREGNTSLHLCAMLNKSECMKCLLRTKPDIAHVKNNDGQTALDIAEEKKYQLCAELLKAAMAGKKDVFDHINIEWDLMTEDCADFSDDEFIESDSRKPRSRPSSLIGGELRDHSPRDRADTDVTPRHIPSKPRKHHLTHPTRFRNSMRGLPGQYSSSNHSTANNSSGHPVPGLSTSLPLSSHHDHPPLPPRGPKKPQHNLPITTPGMDGAVTGTHPSGPLGANQSQSSQSLHNSMEHGVRTGIGLISGNHERSTSDPDSDISYKLHRRTPSEPPPRPFPIESHRNTINIPNKFGSMSAGLNADPDKPAVPPRPRTLSTGNDFVDISPGKKGMSSPADAPPPIPAPRKKKPNYRRCEALFDCDADNEDELSFREGEVIVLLREEEEEWWEGEVENQPERHGLFPISFVKPLPD